MTRLLSWELVRQLITRIDDDLHGRLKARAAAEGRSVNSLVVEALRALTSSEDTPRAALRARADRSGARVVPPAPARVPSRRTVATATRGAGSAASEALARERETR
jgi:antitoxin FitA